MRWRPLPIALAFALIGPLVGALLMLALISPSVAEFGPFVSDAFLDIFVGAYVIGAPSLGFTGYWVARSAERGARLPTLTLQAALLGLVLTGLSVLVWILAGSVVESATGVGIMIAMAGSVGAFTATLLIAGFAAILRRARTAE